MKDKVFYITFLCVVLMCMTSIGVLLTEDSSGGFEKSIKNKQQIKIDDPICIQMYMAIEKYRKIYDIPRNYAYGIAYEETRYGGPFDWSYNQAKESGAGAVGPMQVMPYVGVNLLKKLGRYDEAAALTNHRLKTDIDLNVELSMYLLRRLYDKHGDWKLVFGAYNTGSPCVNGYALDVYSHKPNWKI